MTVTAAPPRAVELSPAQMRDEEARERFERDTAEHELTVLRDDGLYRHLRFQQPGTSFYWYDLITWPGVLAVSGDCGAYVFSRTRDMFEFFAGPRTAPGINPHYWSEKLTAPAGREAVKVYSHGEFVRRVRETVNDWTEDLDDGEAEELRATVETEVIDDPDGYAEVSEDIARQRLTDFRHGDWYFADTWEWDFRDFDSRFLWNCWAIVRGIERYREHGGWAATTYSGTYAAVHAALWGASSELQVRPECLRMLLAVGEQGGSIEGASHDLVGALGSNATCIRRSALELHDAGLIENTSKRGVGMRVTLTERGRELVATMTVAIDSAVRSGSSPDGGAS